MLKGLTQMAQWTTAKIAVVKALIEHTSEFIRLNLPKMYNFELVQVIFEQPYRRIANLVEKDIAKRQTATVYLKQWVDIGVLQEQQVGKEKLFMHPKLMQLMTHTASNFNFTPDFSDAEINKNSILFELPCVPRNNTFSHHLSPQFAIYHRLQTAFFIRYTDDRRTCAHRVY
jgi:hypothetical protein